VKNCLKNSKKARIILRLLNEDFVLERISGSHHIFKRGEVTFVIPVHKNKVKSVYVKRVVEIIEELNDENS
jgi:predicted RNA binding protein YcfA (HicA-like mRNA interferase family)